MRVVCARLLSAPSLNGHPSFKGHVVYTKDAQVAAIVRYLFLLQKAQGDSRRVVAQCTAHLPQTKLQRRARRHATINAVDFSDVTRCQNMVDVSDNVSEHT